MMIDLLFHLQVHRKINFNLRLKKILFWLYYRGDLTTSIICEYSRRDIDSILDGNFKEADSTSFWRELPRDHVPDGVPKNVEFPLFFFILINFI